MTNFRLFVSITQMPDSLKIMIQVSDPLTMLEIDWLARNNGPEKRLLTPCDGLL